MLRKQLKTTHVLCRREMKDYNFRNCQQYIWHVYETNSSIHSDILQEQELSKSWHCQKGGGSNLCRDFFVGFYIVYKGQPKVTMNPKSYHLSKKVPTPHTHTLCKGHTMKSWKTPTIGPFAILISYRMPLFMHEAFYYFNMAMMCTCGVATLKRENSRGLLQ